MPTKVGIKHISNMTCLGLTHWPDQSPVPRKPGSAHRCRALSWHVGAWQQLLSRGMNASLSRAQSRHESTMAARMMPPFSHLRYNCSRLNLCSQVLEQCKGLRLLTWCNTEGG